ncbi:NnrS family protein [Azospirillum sp. ST 5-10]|uniref:NnrS family protein n=1 Tax=unclassified Azospirillum TaxID=2630922 RepID=UPI003F49F9B7
MTADHPPAARRSGGHRLFFPLALAHGALTVPYWTAAHLGLVPTPWTPAVHAHEMLFGFALAVVGGFLLTRPSRAVLALALAAWTLGRAAMVVGLPPALAAPLALAYPAVLFAFAGWPFLRSAKSGHNAVFGPLIGAFVVSEAVFWLADDGGRTGVLLALHLVGLLLFAMGGRIIPAATAGALRRQGGLLVERVQPRLEWAGLAGGTVALVATAADRWPLVGAAGAAAAGVAALARLARWRTAAVGGRADLWSLHLGYGWAGLGWLAAAVEHLAPSASGAGWHVLGSGALGTLAATMMVRASLQRAGRDTAFPPAATLAVLLIAAATLARAAAPLHPMLLPAGAVTWSVALLLILIVVRRILSRR